MKKFKVGIITDEISQDLDTVLRFARKFSLDGLEFRSLEDRLLHTFGDEEIDRLKTHLEREGLAVCGLSSPFFKCDLDNDQEIEEHIAILRRWMDIARKLGVGFIRGFSFWRKEGVSFEQALPRIVEQFRRVTGLLEEAGIVLVLEYEPSVYAGNARKVRELVERVGSPCVMSLYDPGNGMGDPEGEIPYPQAYDRLKGTIRHVHLKDVKVTEAGRKAVAIGSGDVGYGDIFPRLLTDGYEGYIVVETHYRLQSKLTEAQLRRPAGNSFSEGGEAASEECVASLLKLLDEVYTKSGIS